jgi:hypothetical protein
VRQVVDARGEGRGKGGKKGGLGSDSRQLSLVSVSLTMLRLRFATPRPAARAARELLSGWDLCIKHHACAMCGAEQQHASPMLPVVADAGASTGSGVHVQGI